METRLVIDILGWIGSFEIILGYALISSNKVRSTSLLYQILNLTGSLFLIVNTVYYRAFPSAFLNIVWFIIAVWALTSIFRRFIKSAPVRPPATGKDD